MVLAPIPVFFYEFIGRSPRAKSAKRFELSMAYAESIGRSPRAAHEVRGTSELRGPKRGGDKARSGLSSAWLMRFF